MNDIEREVSEFLREEARVQSPLNEMYRHVRRRARLRRIVTASIGGVAAVSVVVGGVVAAGAIRSPSTTQAAGSPPASARPGDRELATRNMVGGGMVSGQTWTLVAYEGPDGLCLDLHVGDGTSNVCGFDTTGERAMGLNVSSQRDVARTAIHGFVSKEVVGLQAILDDGERIDVDIIESPDGFGVDFFAGFLPPDATAVIEARDLQGSLLESEQISPLPGRPS